MSVDVLLRGRELIRGDRQQDYGKPEVNFQRIATGWNAYLHERRTGDLTPLDVANMMIILKAMRGAEGYKEDTYVDVAGYAGLAQVLEEGEFPPDIQRVGSLQPIAGEGA